MRGPEMPAPKTDPRDYPAILKELEDRLSSYLPQLKDRKDASFALLQIYAHMAEHAVDQLNKVPDKNFTAFLNMLGTRLLPAQPARAPLTFYLTTGATEDVLVPARTQVQTSAKDDQTAMSFETEKALTATVSQLKAVFAVNSDNDEIYDHSEVINGVQGITLFEGESLQYHTFYLGHENLFNLANPAAKVGDSSTIQLLFDKSSLDFLKRSNLTWQYLGENKETKNGEWINFKSYPPEETTVDEETDKPFKAVEIVLTKQSADASKLILSNLKSNNRACLKLSEELQRVGDSRGLFWIRALPEKTPERANLPLISLVGLIIYGQVHPDVGLYNDTQLDLTKEFYPFGAQPNTNDIFYLGSQEAFSKTGASITLSFNFPSVTMYMVAFMESHPAAEAELAANKNGNTLVSWEYWDGKSWSSLGRDYDLLETTGHSLVFTCPRVEPTEVSGKKNYWIRARIVSGNYGAFIPGNGFEKPNPPKIKDLTIFYNSRVDKTDYCFTENNLQLTACESGSFQPFELANNQGQSLSLGFDKQFANGKISLFFAIDKQEYPEGQKPQVTWSYLKKDFSGEEAWVPLQVFDTTNDLTESGTLEFLGPSDLSKVRKFGQELYWVRADFAPISKSSEPKPTAENGISPENSGETEIRSGVEIGPCVPMTFFHPTFAVNALKATLSPKIRGIYLNTTWAVQAETVTDEVIGQSDGNPNQDFQVSRMPIISETIWVDEGAIPEEFQENTAGNVIKGSTGEIWVKWNAAEDFFNADKNSRNYTIDRAFGKVQFGNGTNGKIPPIAKSVKATYQTGGGALGNVGAIEIKNLMSSVAFLDKVTNPESAQGGADTENEQRAKEKAPKRLQHRFRAVAKEDYEWLAKEASRAVARVRCIPNLNGSGQNKPGNVALIIVPESKEDLPEPSAELLRIVETYLKKRNPITVKSLTVSFPAYLKFNVTADLYVKNMDAASALRFNASAELKKYLHPLYGGNEKRGWEFGKLPCISDIMGLLQKLPEVQHVENLKITLDETLPEPNAQKSFAVTTDLILPPYTLVCNGVHHFNIASDGGT
jgi:hypothetical protein